MVSRTISAGWWSALKIYECGSESNVSGQTRFRAVSDRCSLYFVLEGSGKLAQEGHSVELANSSVFFLPADGSATFVWNTDTAGEYVFISFSCDGNPDFIGMPASLDTSVKQIILTIRDQMYDADFDIKIYALTYELFRRLLQNDTPPLPSGRSYASYAKAYLDNHFTAQVRIQLVAEQLHIDRRYLTSLFHKEYGIAPHAYLMSLRLNKARELLLAGHSVTEAASMAGFTDLPNFSRQYRARFGITPGSQRTAIPENSP